MLAGCTPGIVIDEVDSVIEDALSETTLAEEPGEITTTSQGDLPGEGAGSEAEGEAGEGD